MPTDDLVFAEQMVEKYQALLLTAAGRRSVQVDGQAITYQDLYAEYNRWRRELARLKGAKPVANTIDLSGQS